MLESNIRDDELILVDSFEAKAEVIVEKGIMAYFDDQPEMLKHVPPSVNVMLVRNGGNFCFEEKLWLFSESTGRLAWAHATTAKGFIGSLPSVGRVMISYIYHDDALPNRSKIVTGFLRPSHRYPPW